MVNDYSFWSWPHKQTALICTLMVWHKHGNLTKSYPRPQEGAINPFTCNGQIGWEYFISINTDGGVIQQWQENKFGSI